MLTYASIFVFCEVSGVSGQKNVKVHELWELVNKK